MLDFNACNDLVDMAFLALDHPDDDEYCALDPKTISKVADEFYRFRLKPNISGGWVSFTPIVDKNEKEIPNQLYKNIFKNGENVQKISMDDAFSMIFTVAGMIDKAINLERK